MRVLSTLILVLIFGCGDSDSNRRSEADSTNWSKLPEEVSIDRLKNTEFVPTLERRVDTGKNIVYAASFLFAWDEFKKIAGMISIPSGASDDLLKLNASRSHTDALDRDEYSASGELVDGVIEVRSFFNVTLPFTHAFHSTEPITFAGNSVISFGASSYSKEIDDQVDIIYYRSDNEFVLRLIPKDSSHHILIAMGISKQRSLAEAVKKIQGWIATGEREKNQSSRAWKYQFMDGDKISIPEFRFNVGKRYSTLEGQKLTTGSVERGIAFAYQRTGFILNKHGAVVESKVEMATDSAGAEIQKPKMMICNKPFYLIAQHKDRPNPYFVMQVRDSELMVRTE